MTRLDEIKARCETATRGGPPWLRDADPTTLLLHDLPWLVSEVERLRGLAVMLRKGCEDGYGHAWRRQHALTCGTCQMIRENFEENGDVR